MTWDQVQTGVAHMALVAWIVAIGILPFAVYIGVVLHGRWVSRHPTADGRVPRDHPLAVRYYGVKELEARRGWLPQSFIYSPHHRNDPVVDQVEEPTPALPVGSIDDLLSHGRGVAYGYRVDNGEVLADDRVRSLLVGGVQGSGKTSFVALVAAQLARMDARVFLADPDALNREGLTPRLHSLGVQPEATGHEPAEVLRLVLNAQHELMTRKGRGSDGRPYVLIVDELPEVLRVLNDYNTIRLRSALELIGGFSGRKHSVVTIMLAQSWMRSVVGSTAVRNLIPASAVFRMRSDEARAMTGLRADYWTADPMDLEPGTFYAVGIDSGAVKVRVPALPPTRVRATLPPASTHFAPASPPLQLPSSAAATSGPGSECEASILELAKRAVPVTEIVRTVYGVRGGAAFQRAAAEVMAVVARALEGPC